LLRLPDGRGRAEALFVAAARSTNHYQAHLVAAVALERNDPELSEKFMNQAERAWRGTRDRFLLEVERLRWILEEE
jgi:hypothetical protein